MAPALFIEACKSFQWNTEVRIKGKEYGSLSYNIWQALMGMPTLDKGSKEKFKTLIEASTKIKGRWHSLTQDLVFEE
jgi:hypothetical protein